MFLNSSKSYHFISVFKVLMKSCNNFDLIVLNIPCFSSLKAIFWVAVETILRNYTYSKKRTYYSFSHSLKMFDTSSVHQTFFLIVDKLFFKYIHKGKIFNIKSCTLTCDFSNVLAFGHNKLWQPRAANSFSITSKKLWPLATTNCGSHRLLMICLWL